MRGSVLPAVLALTLLSGCAVAATAPPPAAAVGRVAFVDGTLGVIVADFDGRRIVLDVDRRELGSYAAGDEIRIDSAGRPLPR